MEAREYLGIIKKNECIIRNKLKEREYWLDMASGTSANISGERVQSSSSKQPMQNKVLEAVAIDEEIAQLKREIAEVISTIEKLDSEDYDFLHKAYVQHMSFKEISAGLGMSYSWSTTTHSRALANLQKLLK